MIDIKSNVRVYAQMKHETKGFSALYGVYAMSRNLKNSDNYINQIHRIRRLNRDVMYLS